MILAADADYALQDAKVSFRGGMEYWLKAWWPPDRHRVAPPGT